MPLLFILLLENAFKHGVENIQQHAFVSVHLGNTKKEIHFSVENNYEPTQTTENAGIGLKNLKRRLTFVYPKKHTLSFAIAVQHIKSIEGNRIYINEHTIPVGAVYKSNVLKLLR